jgi:Asp/Glu/hydantoin racemase
MAIGFLHTAPEHTATFDRLVVELGGLEAGRAHVVVTSLLADAVDRGTDDTDVRSRLVQELEGFPDGVDRIVVTCSTLGGIAEELAPVDGPPVTRVDRPMAEAAVAAGHRIGVAYSISSTVLPTSSLLWEVAAAAGSAIDLDLIDCEGSWKHFAAGRHDLYQRSIADSIRQRAHDVDVVVLSQASMAAVAPLLDDLTIPVLASPGLAVARAMGLSPR